MMAIPRAESRNSRLLRGLAAAAPGLAVCSGFTKLRLRRAERVNEDARLRFIQPTGRVPVAAIFLLKSLLFFP